MLGIIKTFLYILSHLGKGDAYVCSWGENIEYSNHQDKHFVESLYNDGYQILFGQ